MKFLEGRAERAVTPESIASIFLAQYAGLYRYAHTLLKEREAARDAVQQLFTEIWVRRAEIRIAVSLEAYLYRALYNYCINRKTRDQRYVDLGDSLAEQTAPAPNLALECKELQEEITRAIESLPPQCKLIFLKSRTEGKSYSCIAEEQGIAVKTVEAQISKALRIIRSRLERILVLVGTVVWLGYFFTCKFCLWQLFL